MRHILSILAVSVVLAGCSTIIDKPSQEITIETSGTEGALCFLERPGYRTRVWAPKTLTITKSPDPLEVTCRAPGYRERKVVAEPKVARSYFANIANGMVPGALVDYETAAMFVYPEKIVVDFSGVKPQAMPAPEYQRTLAENPEIMGMEEFRPGQSALQRDRYSTTPELQPRRSTAELYSGVAPSASADMPAAYAPSAPLRSTGVAPIAEAPVVPRVAEGAGAADTLTRSMNPQVFGGSGAAASGGPMTISPQQ